MDGGLVICSKLPIVAWEFTKFMEARVYDKLSEKGVLYAKV